MRAQQFINKASKQRLEPKYVAEGDLDRFKKYIRPVVKTTPKIEKKSNPSGRSGDHNEWVVTTPTGEIHRYNSKKQAQEHYDSFGQQGVAESSERDVYKKAYMDGYNGKSFNNPYKPGSDEDDEYDEGWHDGRLDYEKQGVAEASNTMQRYGQKILKRAKAARDAEPETKKEELPASSISTRDLMQQLRRSKKKGVAEGLNEKEYIVIASMGENDYELEFRAKTPEGALMQAKKWQKQNHIREVHFTVKEKGVAEGSLNESETILAEAMLQEAFLDSLRQKLGNAISEPVKNVMNTATALQVLYKIFTNAQFLDTSTFELKRALKRQVQYIQNPKLKQTILSKWPQGRGISDFFKALLLYSVTKAATAANMVGKDQAVDYLVSKIVNIEEIISSIIAAAGGNLLVVLKTLGVADKLFFEILTYINTKIVSSNMAQGVAESLTLDEQFDIIEEMVEQVAAEHGVDPDVIWEDFEAVNDHELFESAAWRRKEGKNKKGGLNAKGVASYRRENPGSKLQTAVTTKPSKLKPGSKAAKRRKSFCARMGGMKGAMKKDGKPTRKALALRKWNC